MVEVNYIDGEATQAVFHFSPDRISLQRDTYLAMAVPGSAAFGEYVGSRTGPVLERGADDLLRVPEAVDSGRVDPVDSEFERAMNGCDGVIVVLRSPCELPA